MRAEVWDLLLLSFSKATPELSPGLPSLSSAPFYKIIVPTVDTMRYNYLVTALVSSQNPVLLVGPVGTGKTSIAQGVLQSLDSSRWAVLVINMSAQVRGRGSQGLFPLAVCSWGGGRCCGGPSSSQLKGTLSCADSLAVSTLTTLLSA